ncbi:hypothetical protein [Pontibacter chinhatensis]|uniref:Lipoprotein n=1 Tax=Pontibacter chinhatensis TaxID=1436961 RepID=A0A1I2QHR8_9BACT|nr:hypothetical protein [Pontibacter chinhatensis]SFG27962.1 hypothetical protein SAMN05421739_10218 [Pontibacter chinhatensis]
MNNVAKAVRYSLLLLLIAGILAACSWRFTESYNKHLALEIEKLDQELKAAADSIPVREVKYKELKRIQELSFTQPVTPEHVRGEELRAVIEGMYSHEVWLINKRREIKRLEKYRQKLHENHITLWD